MSVKVMKWNVGRLSQLLSCLVLAKILGVGAVFAQSITPAPDGTGTIVTPAGNQFNIGGGTQSGANLYQSFQQFGLDQNQIANFLSRPDIQNILGRVVGGDASVINGLVQVTGGNSNLYLMNPAGIIFGANASLNVPASFTATTANGIQVGNNWFKASAANDYATLNGTPNGFAFTQSGTIFNAGTLTVGQGQSLTLMGGTVINLGTIAAPGGQITIAAIPGEKLVRITQAGSLLSLDLPIDTKAQLNSNPLAPLNLPALLTGSTLQAATGVTVENGVVKLANGTAIPTDPGVAIVSGNVTVAPSLPPSSIPQITILGDKVALLNANLNASGINGGGTILIGGDYQGKGTVPNAQFTFVDAGSTIAADALTTGNGGKVILWSDQATRFYGTISARGGSQGGDGGFVEVSGKSNLVFKGNVNTSAPLGTPGQLLLDPTNINIGATAYNGTPGNLAPPVGTTAGDFLWAQADDAALSGEITPAQVVSLLINNDLTLEASNNITVSSAINFDGIGFATNRTLTLRAGNNILINALIDDGNLATTDRLNLVLTGNTDGDPTAGVVRFDAAGGTFTRGGNLTVTNTHSGNFPAIINFTAIDTSGSVAGSGGSITFIGTNTGTGGTFNRGIETVAAITSGGGAITFIGQGNGGTNTSGIGIILFNPVNSGGGNITLTGTSTGTGFSRGIELSGGGGSVTSGGGTVSLTGVTSGTAPGIASFSTINSGIGAIVINGTNTSPTPVFSYGAEVGTLVSTTGNITATGSSVANSGVVVNGTITSTSGDISLTGDRIDVRAAMTSSGNLLLQPLTPTTAMTIGSAGAADTTFLNTTELGFLTNGFNSITIGRTNSTGAIDVQASSFNDNLILRTPAAGSGGIAFNGALNMNGNNLTLNSGGAVTQAAAGNIAASGLELLGTGPYTLTNAANNITTLAGNTTGAISYTDANSFTVGTVNSVGLQSQGDITLNASGSGNITVANNISKTAGAAATLTLNAQNSILVNPGVQIVSTNNPLNVVMTGDSDGNLDGAILLNPGSQINSNNGNITLTGQGTAANIIGIEVDNATLIAGTGNLQLTGTGQAGTSDAQGILVRNAGRLQTTTGNLTLNGTGGSGLTANNGVFIVNTGTTVTSGDGNINITGVGNGTGSFNAATFINSAIVSSTGNGNITLNGTGNGAGQQNIGVRIEGSTGQVTTANGNISLTGTSNGTGTFSIGVGVIFGSLVAAGGNGTVTVTGTGGAGSGISPGIYGGAGSGSRITSVNGNITLIGTGNGAAADNNGIYMENNAIVRSTGTGAISLTGAQTNTAIPGILFLNTSGIVANTGAVTLTTDEIDFSSANSISGNSTLLLQPLTATRPITIGTAANVAGNLTLTTSDLAALTNGFSGITIGRTNSSGAIDLQASTFNDPTTIRTPNAGGTIALSTGTVTTNNNPLTLLADGTIIFNNTLTTGTGDLTVTGSTLNQTGGTISTTGTASFTSTQTNIGNVTATNTNAAGTVLGTSAIGGDFTLTSTGPVTQVGDVQVAGNTSITAPTVSLPNAGNILPNLTTIGNDAIITKVGQVTLPTRTITGNLTVNSLASASAYTSSYGGNAISLNNANTFGGTTRFNTNLTGLTLGTLTGTPGIDQTGIQTVGGTTILNAIGAGSVINLATQNNLLTGAVTLNTGATGGNISLLNTLAGGTILNTATTGANLTLNSTGVVTQTGAITANGLELLGTGPYTLTNAANNITTLAGNTTGVISYTDADSFTVGTVNTIGLQSQGDMTLNALGNGNITVANNISKTAGAAATLTLNAQNSIFVNSGVQITSTADRLNVVMTGDSDNTLDGAIVLNPGSQINSNNGNITLSGQGTAANIIGIQVNNATLNAGTGNLQLTGTGQAGTSDTSGIVVQSGGSLQTTTGTLTLNGNGGSGVDGNRGVFIFGSGTTVSSGDGNISITGVGNGTGQFNIGNNVTGGAIVRSTGNGNITLNGTGNGAGQQNIGVVMDVSSQITAANGNISLMGTSNGTNLFSLGVAVLRGSVVAAGGNGTVDITGTGGAGSSFSSPGIYIGVNTGNQITSVNGNITLTGTGNGTGANNNGIYMRDDASIRSTGAGAISLTGTPAASTTQGILFQNTSGITANTGAVTLTADEMDFSSPNSIIGNSTLLLQPLTPTRNITTGTAANVAGNLTLTTSDLSALTNGFSGVTIGRTNSSGAIDLQASTFNDPTTIQSPIAGGTIAVNGLIQGLDNASLTFNAPTTLNANITTNNNNITFTGISPVTVGTSTTLNAGSGTIAFNNTVAAGANNLTLTADEVNLANTVSGTGNLVIQPSTAGLAIDLGGTGTTAALDLTSAELALLNSFNTITIGQANSGAIGIGSVNPVNLSATTSNVVLNGSAANFNNTLTLANNQTLTLNTATVTSAPAGTDIAIGGTGQLVLNTPGAVGTVGNPLQTSIASVTATTGNLSIANTGNLNFAASTITGNLATIADTFTQTGALSVTGTASFTTTAPNLGDVALRNSAATGTNFAASDVGGNLTLNTTGNASSTGGALRVAGTATINAAGTIAIPDGDDQIANLTTIDGGGSGNVVISQVGPVVLSTANLPAAIGGTLTVNSYTTGTGFTTFNGAAITLDNATNNFGGNISVNTFFNPTPTTLTGVAGITQTAVVNMTNPAAAASFAAVQSSVDNTPAGAITLPLNNILGSINLRGTNATLNETAATILNTTTLTNDLTLTSTGSVTQTGALTVGGNSSFSGTSLTLNNAGNALTGSIALNTSGTASLTNTLATQLNTSTVGGTLDVTANGAITDVGNLSITGVTSLNATGNNITLDNANDFGTVSITNSNNVLLNDINSLDLGASNLTGSLTATALTGTLSTSGAVTAGSDITLTGDTLVLNAALSGPGTLILQPVTPSRTIGIGVTTGQFDLSTATIANLTNGFTQITIGRTNGTGTIQLGTPAPTFNDPVNIPRGNTLIGSNTNTTWAITGSNSGNLNSIFPNGFTFNNIGNLVGGSANDTFAFSDGVNFAGTIGGGAGTDTFDYSAYTTPVTLNVAILGAQSIESAIGSPNNDTLIADKVSNTFNITGLNSGNLNSTFAFTSFENLTGGTANDTFNFANGQGITGVINGGTGSNTLNYTAYTTPVNVNLATNTATGTGGFSNIQSAIGGTGNNTLTGANTNNTFTISSANSGDVNGTFTFTNFGNLAGGNTNDTFRFLPNGSLSGNLNGVNVIDTLDYSAYTAPVTVNLAASAATAIGGSVTSIENIIGNSTNTTLIGLNTNNTFNITDTNTGTVGGVTFSSVQNLTGGTGNDTFVLSNGAGITGALNGGGGSNSLNAAAYTTPVNINLANNTATGTGNISNIQSITGGSGNNTLTGANTTNTFTISGTNSGDINGTFTFNTFQSLMGGSGNDTFTLTTGTVSSVDGGAGNNTLVGSNTDSTFILTATNAGTLNGTTRFTSIANLTGGTGNDTFVFKDGVSIAGIINGGSGFDTLDYTAYTTPIVVNLPANQATGTNGVFNIEQFTTRPLIAPPREKAPEPLVVSCPIAPVTLQVEAEPNSKTPELSQTSTEFDHLCRPIQPVTEKQPLTRSKSLPQPEVLSTPKEMVQ